MSEIQRFTVHGELEPHRVGEVVLIMDHNAALAAKDEQIRVLREALLSIEQETIDHVAVRVARAALASAPEGEKQP